MQITSESVKVGHPDIVADSIAANIIAEIFNEENKIGMDIHDAALRPGSFSWQGTLRCWRRSFHKSLY